MQPIHAIQNFQIPVKDFDRARTFYSKIMGYELEEMEHNGIRLGIFRRDPEQGIGGTIIYGIDQKPSKEGTLIYLHCGEDLEDNIGRVTEAGGVVQIDKTHLGPDMGYFAIFDDTEGNRVGMYSTG